jgi:hypothetical protein
VNRWVPLDDGYDLPRGPARPARPPAYKWLGLLAVWIIVTAVLSITHLGVLLIVIMVGLICYVVYAILRDTPTSRRRTADLRMPEREPDWQSRRQFNAPPGWPEPPPGWEPPRGWLPDRSWPSAPPGWEFWVWPYDHERGQRVGRYRRTDRNRDYGI